MDMDMFLDKYPLWEAEGLHHPLILQMFLQAARARRREAECLDLQADISAVPSVGPQTSTEEIRDLYYQAYKLRRLPRSLSCGLERADALARDNVSSLKNCLRQTEDEPPGAAAHLM